MREWGNALQAAVRNSGDVSGTLRDANARRNVEGRRRALLERQGEILKISADKGADVDRALEEVKRRNGGVLPARLRVLVLQGFILGGHHAKFVFFETDDPTRIDIYYAGEDTPDGENHGHIVIRKGQIETWWAHGANKEGRLKIV